MIYTQNRELSWLKFNERVLCQSCDEDTPIFERLKFLAIYSGNLDEFFMVRVGKLANRLQTDSVDAKTGMTSKKQLKKIFSAVEPLYKMRDKLYDHVKCDLKAKGVYLLNPKELTGGERKFVRDYFLKIILPVLSPQVINKLHSFPFLENKQQYVLVSMGSGKNAAYGIIPIPTALPKILLLPGESLRCVQVCDIALEYCARAFPMYKLKSKNLMRITRNADLSPERLDLPIENTDRRSAMKKLLKKRGRLAAVRLESREKLDPRLKNILLKKLGLTERQLFVSRCPLDMSYAFLLENKLSPKHRETLCYIPIVPAAVPMSGAKKGGDTLLSLPYDSIQPFFDLIRRCACDKRVLSIKIALYRLAENSRLAEYLCMAAQNGKKVTVIIELRARFDEQSNICWSERLEKAGCRVQYGFPGLKIHAKLCLITLRERGNVRYITQIGTGNYNEDTAEKYTDLCLLTKNREIGLDARKLFENMALCKIGGEYRHLLVSPGAMEGQLMAMLEQEIAMGENGLVVMKVNALTDMQLIKKLREASCAGVKIYLLVRGICCLLPGIMGETENITVCSIVGRFLEHSRIYSFGRGERQRIYISSADAMTRSMKKRVELACPIYDSGVKSRINRLLELNFNDNVSGRILNSNGDYEKKPPQSERTDSQELLMRENVATALPPKKQGFFRRLFSGKA